MIVRSIYGGKIMARCDMNGFATSRELSELYLSLSLMSTEERRQKKFALFVVSKGMLDGEQAYNYLKEKYFSGV